MGTNRSNGTMVERRPGVWMLQVTTGYKPNGTAIRSSKTFRGTKKQAAAALAAFYTDARRGQVLQPNDTSLEAFLNRWIDHLVAAKRSPTTIRGYRDKARRISAKLGKIRIDKLTVRQLDQAYGDWLNEGLDPNTVHHLHGVLSAALNQAVKWDLLPQAVTEKASPPPLRLRPKQIPTPQVIGRLIDEAESRSQPVLAAVVALTATTGLRRGEVSGLRWPDVEFDTRQLVVRRSVKHADGPGWVVGPPKTHQQRTIAIDDFALEVLASHKQRAEKVASDAGVTLDPNAYVFTLDPSGTDFLKPDSLGQAFGRLCRGLGLTWLSLHTLRHFSASELVGSGRDVRTIAGRLGHADATTTLRVYAHMIEGRDRDAADYLGSLFASGSRASLAKGRPVDAVQTSDREAAGNLA